MLQMVRPIRSKKLSDISKFNPLFSYFRTSSGFCISAFLPANLIGDKKPDTSLELFDLSGKMVGHFNSKNFITQSSNEHTFFFKITGGCNSTPINTRQERVFR